MKRSALTNSARAEDILTRTIDVEFDPDNILTLVVSVPALRAEKARLDAIGSITDEHEAKVESAESFVRVVKSWNLENVDGTPAPLTVDFIVDELGEIELFVMTTVIGQELAASVEPGKGRPGTSGSSAPSTKQAKKPRKR